MPRRTRSTLPLVGARPRRPPRSSLPRPLLLLELPLPRPIWVGRSSDRNPGLSGVALHCDICLGMAAGFSSKMSSHLWILTYTMFRDM
eukprot:6863603-Prymnesium_polylepis.1